VPLTTKTHRTEDLIDHFIDVHEQLVWNGQAKGFGCYLAGGAAGWIPCFARNTNQPKKSIFPGRRLSAVPGFFGLRNFTLANATQRYIGEGRVGVESKTERKCSAPSFFGGAAGRPRRNTVGRQGDYTRRCPW
jgi:hypothetical protein